MGTSIGMKIVKWKNILIKDNITIIVDTSRTNIKAFVPFMKITIAKKSTLQGTEGEFMSVIGTQVRPTSTAKNTKEIIGRFGVQNTL